MTSSSLQLDNATVVNPAPSFTVGGAILAKWNSLGGAAGLLGAAQSSDTTCPDGVGHFVRFANGMIYWTPATGAFSVHGSILAKWGSLGWERCAFLGYPISDETGCPDGVGRFNRFQNGMIYWTPATGAFSVHGSILDKWSSLGYEKSQLGYPVSDEGDLAGGGRVNSFQHGSIDWTAAKGAWVNTSIPGQLDYNFSPIVFDNGVPVGGFAHLTIKPDGSYVFSGHFHDSGATAYSTSLIYAVKDSSNQVYTFSHSGSVAGTFESGSRDDNWNVTGVNPAIASNWAKLLNGGSSVAKASANLDILALGSSVITALGIIAKIVTVVGKAIGSGDGGDS